LPNKVQATPTQIQTTFILYSNATSTVEACQNREYLQHEAVIRTRNLQKTPSNPKLNKIHYNRHRPVEKQFRKPTKAQAKLGIMGHNSRGGNTRIGSFPNIDGLYKIKFHDSLPHHFQIMIVTAFPVKVQRFRSRLITFQAVPVQALQGRSAGHRQLLMPSRPEQ
jgi:hypothetical protein